MTDEKRLFKKIPNKQLINLCHSCLYDVLKDEAMYRVCPEYKWKCLTDAVDELQRRAGLHEDLDKFETNEFCFLIEKATSIINFVANLLQ